MNHVLIAGSRQHLTQAQNLTIHAMVKKILPSNIIHVGCCSGVDAAVVTAALAMPQNLQIYSIADSKGNGYTRNWSNMRGVSTAAGLGATVHWLAGGTLSVPIRARLKLRSLAALRYCTTAIVYITAYNSPGSLAIATAAAKKGIPTHLIPLYPQHTASTIPTLACHGQWATTNYANTHAYIWQHKKIQATLF